MSLCFFATDLHGRTDRYDKLLRSILDERPEAVFLGGDLLPYLSLSAGRSGQSDFIGDYLLPAFGEARKALGKWYPAVFVILGNDDPRCVEKDFVDAEAKGLWHYVHRQKHTWGAFPSTDWLTFPPRLFY